LTQSIGACIGRIIGDCTQTFGAQICNADECFWCLPLQELINQMDDISDTLSAYGIPLPDTRELSGNKALAKADLTPSTRS
jgi:hypothetical protein